MLLGIKGKIFKKEIPEWIGLKKDIIATVDLDKDGNDKYDENGDLSCRFKVPTEQEWDEEWELIKAKTQSELNATGKTVGAYIYDTLLQMPNQKIRGKLVRTIEREYYKSELHQILEKQKEFHEEFQNKDLFLACVNELYPQNEAHRNEISGRDLVYLFIEDILFYQRPLKSKKSLISDCPYEEYVHADEKTGEEKHFGVKCIAKSHPLYQEFRLWQFISNLRIYQREKVIEGKKCFDVDVTSVFLKTEDDYTDLFDWLNKQTVKPSHVFFMQTLVEEKEDEEVLQMLQKAENVEIVPIEKKDFDHGGTRNKGAALSRADYMLFMTQDAVPADPFPWRSAFLCL